MAEQDLSVRVPAKMGFHLLFEVRDLGVQRRQDRNERPDRRRIRRGHGIGLAEMLGAQYLLDRRRFGLDVTAAFNAAVICRRVRSAAASGVEALASRASTEAEVNPSGV